MSLRIQDLAVLDRASARLLGPLSLRLEPGARVGLVGESGSGKSLLVKALFGVLPTEVKRAGGTSTFQGRHLMALGQPLGRWVGWVPQEPLQALNPFLRAREHLGLLPRAYLQEPLPGALKRLMPVLERLRLPTDPGFLGKFPHQMSGGERQRLILVMAISCNPELLILDEPTTALDPSAQAEVVGLIQELHRERGLGYLWISHDLGIIDLVSDRILVLYGGELLEAGPRGRLLAAPRSPYTARLLSAARWECPEESGFLPAPSRRPEGCPFQPRCPRQGPSCASWGPWVGTPEDGFRCEQPLRQTGV